MFDAVINRTSPPPLGRALSKINEETSAADQIGRGDNKLNIKRVNKQIKSTDAAELRHGPCTAFLFDARYVPNRGVACYIKVMGPAMDFSKLKSFTSYHTSKRYDLFEIGIVQPAMKKVDYLPHGQVGYFLSSMKSVKEAQIGDTFYDDKAAQREEIEAFPGYDTPQSMVFSGIYPEDPDDYEELEKSLMKLALTDGSVEINYESSAALGSGFRCGFLGMLHLDVFR